MLLEKEADINALDHTNWTPLHFAAEKGYDQIATVLLKHGADVNVKENQNKCTALHLAAQYGHPKVVKTLIINGADVNAKMDKNATPLHLGAQIGNLDIVRSLLMSGAYFNARAEEGRYVLPLHFAERRGNPEVIKLLKLTEKLFKAIEDNNYLGIESSIRDGAIIDSKNVDGRTPLHYAVNNGHIKVVNILLANGADATKVTNKGNTPLHTAASKGHKEIIEALLQRVSHNKLSDFINAKTIVKGTTSLHVATENSFFEAVKSLLKHGAIYNIKNKEGKTPLDLSRDQNITNLLKLVEELFENAKNGNVEIISKLRAIKPDERVAVTNARDDQGKSLVQVAVINKHLNLASRLLEILKSPDQSLQDVSVENRVKSLKL